MIRSFSYYFFHGDGVAVIAGRKSEIRRSFGIFFKKILSGFSFSPPLISSEKTE